MFMENDLGETKRFRGKLFGVYLSECVVQLSRYPKGCLLSKIFSGRWLCHFNNTQDFKIIIRENMFKTFQNCGKNHLQLVGLSWGLPKYCIYTCQIFAD